MAVRRTETAGGISDGVNATFTTSLGYRPGTLTVQINGIVCEPDEVTEINSNTFALSSPPKATAVVSVRYTVAS